MIPFWIDLEVSAMLQAVAGIALVAPWLWKMLTGHGYGV